MYVCSQESQGYFHYDKFFTDRELCSTPSVWFYWTPMRLQPRSCRPLKHQIKLKVDCTIQFTLHHLYVYLCVQSLSISQVKFKQMCRLRQVEGRGRLSIPLNVLSRFAGITFPSLLSVVSTFVPYPCSLASKSLAPVSYFRTNDTNVPPNYIKVQCT